MGTHLVGRAGELGALGSLLGAPGCAVLVHGEAGVGKTVLVEAALDGRPVAQGGALASLSWLDHLPLRRALGDRMDDDDWLGDAEDVAERVCAAVGDRVLFLDDLHWADEATVTVAEVLARRVPLVVSVRRGAPRAPAVRDRLMTAGFTVLEVEPLDDDAAGELVRTLAAGLPGHRVDELVARSGGNPLILEELVRSPSRPDTLKLALGVRLRDLGEEARQGLALLAFAGRPLPAEKVPGPAELEAAGLLRRSTGAVELRHSLIAEVVVELIGPERRRWAHRRLGELLEHPGDRARHLLAAGDPEAAYPLAIRALDEAATPGERAAHLRTAAGCAHGPAAHDLVLRAARAANDAGDPAGAAELLAALDGGTDPTDVAVLVERGRALFELGDADGWRGTVEQGLAVATEERDRVYFRTEEAAVAYFLENDATKAAELAGEAAATAEAVGAPRAAALRMLGTAQYLLGDPAWTATLEHAVSCASAEDDVPGLFAAANNLVSAHESAGDPALGAELADRFAARALELKLGHWQRHFLTRRLSLALHAGDHELVRSLADQLLESPLLPRSREEVMVALAGSMADTGRGLEALALCEQLREARTRPSDRHAVRAQALVALGRPVEALQEREPFLAAQPVPSMVALLAPTFALAAYDADQPVPAEATDLPAWGMLAGVPHELRAMAELRAGRADEAADGFAEAASLWSPYHRRGELRSRWARGEALSRAGRADEARAVLLALERELDDGGWLPLLGRCRRSLRALGERRDAVRGDGRGPLTAREREVVRLIGRGLSDAAIANSLGISVRTVQSQVASARRKLGAGNRRHAAELLDRLGE